VDPFFYNYKDYCSIVLLAIVNAEYDFIYVHVGWNGRNSDSGVIENTTFYDKLKANMLNLPTTGIMEGKFNLFLWLMMHIHYTKMY
jgi:hypothetical protein